MRTNTAGILTGRSPSQMHRPKDRFAAQAQFTRRASNNHRGPELPKNHCKPSQPNP